MPVQAIHLRYGNHSNSQIELGQAWLENFNFFSGRMTPTVEHAKKQTLATWLKAKHPQTTKKPSLPGPDRG